MSLDTWLLYAVATLLLSLTPGPNGLLALNHGARYGARRTLATIAGGVLGFVILIGVAMSGLGALLLASERAFTALRWLGALYLVWLGVGLWRRPAATYRSTLAREGDPRSSSTLFAQGFLVALSNPKVILFFTAFLPQFLDPAASLALQFVIMASTFALTELLVEGLLAVSAARVLPWLSTASNARLFDRITGALFVGAGVGLIGWQR